MRQVVSSDEGCLLLKQARRQKRGNFQSFLLSLSFLEAQSNNNNAVTTLLFARHAYHAADLSALASFLLASKTHQRLHQSRIYYLIPYLTY